MIVQSITNNWDMVYNQYRNTVYRTLVDPVSDKKIIEVVQYLYDKRGEVTPTAKGQVIDIQT